MFLDTRVVCSGKILHTELYRKSSDKYPLLCFKGCHPRTMVKSILYSQSLRVRRILAIDDKFEHTLDVMSYKFKERGYPPQLISRQRKKICNIDHQQALYKENPLNKSPRILFILSFNDLSPLISHVMKKHWYVLRDSFKDIPDFQALPLI